jgi:hypothetical protein
MWEIKKYKTMSKITEVNGVHVGDTFPYHHHIFRVMSFDDNNTARIQAVCNFEFSLPVDVIQQRLGLKIGCINGTQKE